MADRPEEPGTIEPRLQDSATVARAIRVGDRRALARAISWVDRMDARGDAVVGDLLDLAGSAHVIGITGPPGAGKSTLVNRLVRRFRYDDARIGVVMIDPSSPFTGGAVLGDRLRMNDHLGDDSVFIRSLASRGSVGGLSVTTPAAVGLMEAWGATKVLVETVGVGQNEVQIATESDTVLLVLSPGTGDEMQALKSGVMEVPDVIAVNSRGPDLALVADAVRDIRTIAHLSSLRTRVSVVAINAVTGEGIDELVGALEVQQQRATRPARRGDPRTSWAARHLDAALQRRLEAALNSSDGRAVLRALASDGPMTTGEAIGRIFSVALADHR